MGEMLQQNWSDADVDEIFRRVDTDQSGAIELEEVSFSLSFPTVFRQFRLFSD